MKKYINLLPPEDQRQLRLAKLNNQVLSFGVWVGVSFLVMASLLFSGQIFLQTELRIVTEQVVAETAALEELRGTILLKEVQTLNRDISNFKTLEKEHQAWSGVLIELTSLLPSDMTLDSIMIDRLEQKVEITGHAASRNSVLELRRNLLSSKYFKQVNFPLSNLEKPQNLEWKYRMFLNPENLK